MRAAKVFYKGELAGRLVQQDDGLFIFTYQEDWLQDESRPAISLTLPKRQKVYRSKYLFPFLYNMLPEGANKQVVCQQFRIDASDDFGILLHTASFDAIGAVTVQREERG